MEKSKYVVIGPHISYELDKKEIETIISNDKKKNKKHIKLKDLKKILFSLLLITQVSFGQKVFKIKEGELQFIHPEKGVFVKKSNSLYHLKLEDIDHFEGLTKPLKYELEKVTEKEFEQVQKDSSTIIASKIISFDFKKLDNQRFTTKNDINEDDNYRFYKYNKNFFVVSVLEDSIQHQRNEYLIPYCILNFGGNKKIMYHSKGFIVPTKEKTQFLFDRSNLNDSFKNYDVSVYKNLNAIDIQVEQNELKLNSHFYTIDTLKNKKLQIKNPYNETVINKSFDSIVSNDYFIIGYRKGKTEIYNYTFKKFNLKNIRAFNFARFYPNMQIIEGDSLRRINLIGENYKKEDASYSTDGAQYFPDMGTGFEITAENDEFYITGEISSLVLNFGDSRRKHKLYNREQFETIQYANEGLYTITSYSEMMGTTMSYPVCFYTKLKNGKFNLNTLDYLIAENPSIEIENYNNQLPKNCDNITVLDQQNYRIEKNGLFTYYPMMKEIKYKKLDNFKGNYARFELPNGQKGWLSLDGKEYLDQNF
ncbi:hypothetical protein [Flavobacterium hungaricum]|uniref:WG repeat-containing protein n=1 Tax=Flavobacterium hungaricum TaxID=2082725 RepID=A0ABR9TGM7_9FLAO|nr:hypothetical protein [Flavobacterium hungaricum]MBE8724517.1 hypothetical protein [Flavobacterium hungaricum]